MSDFEHITDQFNGFSWGKKIIKLINDPHLAGGLKGPQALCRIYKKGAIGPQS